MGEGYVTGEHLVRRLRRVGAGQRGGSHVKQLRCGGPAQWRAQAFPLFFWHVPNSVIII